VELQRRVEKQSFASPFGAELKELLLRGDERWISRRPWIYIDYPLCIVIDDVTIIIIYNYPLLYHYP
jgi:hypothetical protein